MISKFQVSGFKFQVSGFLLLLCSCASPKPSSTDPVIAQFASSAHAAYERDAFQPSARFYEQALTRARILDDSAEIGRNAYNLAACYLLLDRPAEAHHLLQEARGEIVRSGGNTDAVDVLDAKAARAEGRKDDAVRQLNDVSKSTKDEAVRLEASLLLGEIAADAEDRVGAEEHLKAADKIAKSVDNTALSASRYNLSGRVATLYVKDKAAAGDFDQAAGLFQKADRFRDMANALGHAGEAYAAAGDPRAAADRFYRGARSLYAQGDAVAALKLIERGVTAAESTDDVSLQARLAYLFNEIKGAVQDAK